MILDIQGAAGLAERRVPVDEVITSANQVKLKYFHFPDLPLRDAFAGAVAVNNNPKDIEASNSVYDIVAQLDALDDGSGNRILYAWYDGSEIELCTAALPVTLSAAFAAFLKMPVVLTANTCYSSSLYESIVSEYSHFAVVVGHVRGFFDGHGYNEVIAKIRRDKDISTVHSHYFRGPVTLIKLRVTVVKRDGTILPYTSPEIWSLGLQVT